MIPKNEIKQKAREYEVPESTIERDYAQNWLLMALSSLPFVLKGGTGIRKMYIGAYRFSDDLDFTLLDRIEREELKKMIENAVRVAREESGISFSEDVEFSENENGFKINVYFQIMQRGESRTRIKIDITECKNEKILLPVNTREILHPYSDNLNGTVKVYALEEIMAEKIRSLFQRTRPRDLYDIWYLWDKIDRRKVLNILPEKFRAKNVEMDIKGLESRKGDFKDAWESSLKHQLKELPDFEEVFFKCYGEVERMCIEIIRNKREEILTGEIGALLHDIGKLHPDFIKKHSKEGNKSFDHANIDEFSEARVVNLIKNDRFRIKINNKEADVYSLITKHHLKDNDLKSDPYKDLILLIKSCDRLDSADDKGIVREKQSLNNVIIASPFGYPKEKIDLNCLQKRFDDLQDNLIRLFKNYISETMDLSCFRESLISNLRTAFSHALGETRIPSNDVTLWDHSYSTASLFKSVLAGTVCGENLTPQNLKWRIFGVCWDGEEFINKGRKIAEIQKRVEIIEDIERELKKKFEDEIPIGNVIYEDINGIYFTFPHLNKPKKPAKECAKIGLKIIRDESDNEIWPFFTLSKSSRSLTIIADELRFAYEKRKIPKISPVLFVGEDKKKERDKEDIEVSINLENELKNEIEKIKNENEDAKIDICPICRIRPKDEKKERCDVCEGRRKGRLTNWINNRKNTVWTDEAADKNNRIALISLNFYLDKWLDGTMIGTIYSQSFEDWFYGEKRKKENNIWIMKSTIQLLRDAGVSEMIQPSKETIFFLLGEVLKDLNKDKKKAAETLDTFFQDVSITKKLIDQHIKNIKERKGISSLTKENLATYLFTQNPSPARLYRIWNEAAEFFDLVINEVKGGIYSPRWKRIKFNINDIDSKLKENAKLSKNTPYIIKIKGVEPDNILVFHTKNGEFYTIESLGKFRFHNKTGEEGVKDVLKQGFKRLALEDDPNTNLLKELSDDGKIKPNEDDIKIEEYYPLIEINRSPLSLCLIVPALDSMKIIDLITKLYNYRFSRAVGKLPLNVKLLVANRKFPLYILLDSENRMLEGEELKKQMPMTSWWNVNRMRNNKYYDLYPTKSIEGKKYTLDDLSPISKGRIFHLYPGYFDFDLLLGTTDRYNIYYKGKRRGSEDYKLFTGRPYYFYQIPEILEMWDVLSNLSSSQINFIEEMLTSKLREWRNIGDCLLYTSPSPRDS